MTTYTSGSKTVNLIASEVDALRHENELLKARLAEAIAALHRADRELTERDAEIAELQARGSYISGWGR